MEKKEKYLFPIPSKFIKVDDSSKAQSSIKADLSLETEDLEYVSLKKG